MTASGDPSRSTSAHTGRPGPVRSDADAKPNPVHGHTPVATILGLQQRRVGDGELRAADGERRDRAQHGSGDPDGPEISGAPHAEVRRQTLSVDPSPVRVERVDTSVGWKALRYATTTSFRPSPSTSPTAAATIDTRRPGGSGRRRGCTGARGDDGPQQRPPPVLEVGGVAAWRDPPGEVGPQVTTGGGADPVGDHAVAIGQHLQQSRRSSCPAGSDRTRGSRGWSR